MTAAQAPHSPVRNYGALVPGFELLGARVARQQRGPASVQRVGELRGDDRAYERLQGPLVGASQRHDGGAAAGRAAPGPGGLLAAVDELRDSGLAGLVGRVQ